MRRRPPGRDGRSAAQAGTSLTTQRQRRAQRRRRTPCTCRRRGQRHGVTEGGDDGETPAPAPPPRGRAARPAADSPPTSRTSAPAAAKARAWRPRRPPPGRPSPRTSRASRFRMPMTQVRWPQAQMAAPTRVAGAAGRTGGRGWRRARRPAGRLADGERRAAIPPAPWPSAASVGSAARPAASAPCCAAVAATRAPVGAEHSLCADRPAAAPAKRRPRRARACRGRRRRRGGVAHAGEKAGTCPPGRLSRAKLVDTPHPPRNQRRRRRGRGPPPRPPGGARPCTSGEHGGAAPPRGDALSPGEDGPSGAPSIAGRRGYAPPRATHRRGAQDICAVDALGRAAQSVGARAAAQARRDRGAARATPSLTRNSS